MSSRGWKLPSRRDLRLASGLILFFYVATHLATHASGLHSVALAERLLRISVLLWHSLPGSILLYGACTVHVVLALHAIYQRRTLRMPPLDMLRIALGLAIPTLLIGHAAATRLAFEMYGHLPTYTRIIWNLWNSDNEGRQLALLAPGWLHGCLGVYYAFNRRTWFQRAWLLLFGLALLLPVLSAVGFFTMGKELAARSADLAWIHANAAPVDAAHRLGLLRIRDSLFALYLGAIGAVFAARALRGWLEAQRGALVTISYPGRRVRVPRGWSVLDASRSNHIPHQSMCGGRARCSTCRVRVTAGGDNCPVPAADEATTLARIGAGADVRLACQLRPAGDIAVVPLLEASVSQAQAGAEGGAMESEIVILEAELIGWRELAPAMLLQDRLFVVQAFSEAAGAAIHHAGGVFNPLRGDSAAGVFAGGRPAAQSARRAVLAARAILMQAEALRKKIPQAAGAVLDIGIRIHAGVAATSAAGASGGAAANAIIATGPALDGMRCMTAFEACSDGKLWMSQQVAELAGINLAEAVAAVTIAGDPPLRALGFSKAAIERVAA